MINDDQSKIPETTTEYPDVLRGEIGSFMDTAMPIPPQVSVSGWANPGWMFPSKPSKSNLDKQE